MSRCGSCPAYGCGVFGVHCSGDYGVEECSDTLQELYYATVNALQSPQPGARGEETCKTRSVEVSITPSGKRSWK